MRIGELAGTTGVDVETIRYYEKAALLPQPPRQANGYRDYDERHMERLAFIRRCRELDMPLADVKRLLDFAAHPEAGCGDINCLVDEQLVRVRARLESLRALERQLVELRAHCGENLTAGECGILRELLVAGRP